MVPAVVVQTPVKSVNLLLECESSINTPAACKCCLIGLTALPPLQKKGTREQQSSLDLKTKRLVLRKQHKCGTTTANTAEKILEILA